MNATVLESHFSNTVEDFISLNKKQKIECQTATFDYIFKACSASAYEAKLRHIIRRPVRLIEARRNLLKNGYLMQDVKLFLLQKSCGVRKPIDLGYDNRLWRYTTTQQRDRLKKLGKNVPILKDDFDEFIIYLLENTRDYTAKFVRRKMTFIKTSQGLEYSDIESFITIESLQNILFTYPNFDSIEHALNSMKRIIHNVGINFIDSNTTQKAGRLISEGGTFHNRIIDKESDYAIVAMGQDQTVLEEQKSENFQFHFNLEISKIRDAYKGKKLKLVDLCLANYCKDFSDYLRKNNVTRRDNDDWFYSSNFHDYVGHAIKFLNAPEDKARIFVSRLMEKIKPYYDMR